eukprot:Gb_30097 [translate_table: standard]
MAQPLRNQKKKTGLFLRPILQLQVRNGNANNRSLEDVRNLCKQGRLKEALYILRRINQSVDTFTYVCLLQACIQKKALSEGKFIHAHMNERGFRPDSVLRDLNTLVNMYAKCGSLEDARRVFDQMPKRDVFSWTVMISAYSSQGFSEEALSLYHQMQRIGVQPNQFTFASVLPACSNLPALQQGMDIHEEIIESGFQSDVFVRNALIDMYAKCRCTEKARHLFDQMPERDVVSWTAMISGYAQNGQAVEAMKLFQQIQMAGVQPNSNTFASVLPACANLAALQQGMEIHKEIIRNGFESDVFVQNALVDMYAKCGSIEKARDLFDKIHHRNVISWTTMIAGYAQNGDVDEAFNLFQKIPEPDAVAWNAMIAGYAQNGNVDEALELFENMPGPDVVSWNTMIAGYAQNGQCVGALKLYQQMQLAGVKPDARTFSSVLPACANLAALEQGMDIHETINRSGFQFDLFVANALLDMYAKCGSIEKAHNLFDKMHERNVISWNAMIAGYAMHGCGKEALDLFEQMQSSGINPSDVTFVCVLSACCHAGLVDEGRQYFDCMTQYYQITPTMKHYVCMVDLLGRAGHLDEAHDLINTMPIKPDAVMWGCLLGACRKHNNIELGECAAEHIFQLDPRNATPYVLLSNMYAAAGRWDDIENETGHTPRHGKFMMLERLSRQLKVAGYVPDMIFVLNGVEEDQKEQILCHHSKKFAIAFGLINTYPGKAIGLSRIFKCVMTTTLPQSSFPRLLPEKLLRDANSYHHFKDGQCSCGNYW